MTLLKSNTRENNGAPVSTDRAAYEEQMAEIAQRLPCSFMVFKTKEGVTPILESGPD